MTHATTPDVMTDAEKVTAVFSLLPNWYPDGGHGMDVTMQMTRESTAVAPLFTLLPNTLLIAVKI
jgi:hypothetical protein